MASDARGRVWRTAMGDLIEVYDGRATVHDSGFCAVLRCGPEVAEGATELVPRPDAAVLRERIALAIAHRVNDREPDDGAYDLADAAMVAVTECGLVVGP